MYLQGSKISLPSEQMFRKGIQMRVGLHKTGFCAVRTRLWRWMVYSRATTSAMAERAALPLGWVFGWVLGVGIVAVYMRY